MTAQPVDTGVHVPVTKTELSRIAIRDAHADLAKNQRFGWLTTRIYVADLAFILDRLAEDCPLHMYCDWCQGHVCPERCGLGAWASCGCDVMHCTSEDCLARCIAENHLDDDRHAPASWAGLLR